MSDTEKNDQNLSPEDSEDLFAGMSLDELLQSAKDDIARVDELMGPGAQSADIPEDEPQEKTDAKQNTSTMKPLFEPKIPEEYADLMTDEEQAVQEPEEERPRYRMPAGVRVLMYVCFVLAASIVLAVGIWKCADDVLALTKPDQDISVTIRDSATIEQISKELEANGLVKYGWLFRLYCLFSHAERTIQPGTYVLNNRYDYHALVNGMVSTSGNRVIVEITIPEGYECDDIFRLLAEQGVCSYRELADTAASYDFGYDFLADLPYGSTTRLEGYLFPDTYQFYEQDDPEKVIGKFLKNFDNKVTAELREDVDALNLRLAARMRENGFTEDEIRDKKLTLFDVVTVASLVEKETAKTSESASIASVIYNRLCSKLYPLLEIDATIQYVLAERKETLTNADKGVISPYNTYTNAGLPAGPIANPGLASIRAALYPADTDYYFYALGNDGVHHFSSTYFEHQAFLEELREQTQEPAPEIQPEQQQTQTEETETQTDAP